MTALGELELTNSVNGGTPATETIDSDVPTIDTLAARRTAPRVKKCRDLVLGVEALRDGHEIYLPRYPQEHPAMYEARRTISALFNGYARTVLAITGLVVDKGPTLDKDMPPQLVTLAENVDRMGTHLTVFTKKLTNAAVVDGFAGIITEYPRPDDKTLNLAGVSLATRRALQSGGTIDADDEEKLGLRPYFILCKVDEVLPLYETVNGLKTLVMLIRKEVSTEKKGRFGRKSVTRYYVYELAKGKVTYQRWSVPDGQQNPTADGEPVPMRGKGSKPLRAIPRSPLAAGAQLGEHEYKPMLQDLADLNITHHRIATGILSLEELAFVPTPVRVGATSTTNPDGSVTFPPLIFGPGNTIEAPATEGVDTPVYWLTPPVDVLDPAMKSLENCKAEMGALGATFLAPQPVQQETATASRMDASAEQASTTSLSQAVKDCLESAFGFAGRYVGEKAGSVKMNPVLAGEGISLEYLTLLMTAFQELAITREEFRFALQTGQLPETFKADAKLTQLAEKAAEADLATQDAA